MVAGPEETLTSGDCFGPRIRQAATKPQYCGNPALRISTAHLVLVGIRAVSTFQGQMVLTAAAAAAEAGQAEMV
jgi:hypothetical protein